MPYTFTVNSEVVVHETVSIPASEHSSSKVVTIREPVSIHVTVDDTAFNSSVMACDARIDSVNDSVVDSVRRQSEAKKESAKVISKSVLDGFYKYAASDFRQQMVEHENVVNSTLPKIQTYMAQLQDLERRMESDYTLISKRYVGIFKGYDEELDRNMHRLYDPLFELYDDCQTKLLVESRTEALSASIGFEDISTVQAMMVQAKLKTTLLSVMRRLTASLASRRRIDQSLERLAENRVVSKPVTCHLPLVYFERDSLLDGGRKEDEVHLNLDGDGARSRALAQRAKECIIAGGLEVDNSAKDDERMDLDFMARLSQVGDERRAREILRLYDDYKKRRKA